MFNGVGSEVYAQYVFAYYIIYFAIVQDDDDANNTSKCASIPKLKSFLCSNYVQFLGKISMALYLIHFLLLGIVLRELFQLQHPFIVPPFKGNFLHTLGSLSIVIPLSILSGWVLTTYVEEPARKWLRK